jgi:hypothetical protein
MLKPFDPPLVYWSQNQIEIKQKPTNTKKMKFLAPVLIALVTIQAVAATSSDPNAPVSAVFEKESSRFETLTQKKPSTIRGARMAKPRKLTASFEPVSIADAGRDAPVAYHGDARFLASTNSTNSTNSTGTNRTYTTNSTSPMNGTYISSNSTGRTNSTNPTYISTNSTGTNPTYITNSTSRMNSTYISSNSTGRTNSTNPTYSSTNSTGTNRTYITNSTSRMNSTYISSNSTGRTNSTNRTYSSTNSTSLTKDTTFFY